MTFSLPLAANAGQCLRHQVCRLQLALLDQEHDASAVATGLVSEAMSKTVSAVIGTFSGLTAREPYALRNTTSSSWTTTTTAPGQSLASAPPQPRVDLREFELCRGRPRAAPRWTGNQSEQDESEHGALTGYFFIRYWARSRVRRQVSVAERTKTSLRSLIHDPTSRCLPSLPPTVRADFQHPCLAPAERWSMLLRASPARRVSGWRPCRPIAFDLQRGRACSTSSFTARPSTESAGWSGIVPRWAGLFERELSARRDVQSTASVSAASTVHGSR